MFLRFLPSLVSSLVISCFLSWNVLADDIGPGFKQVNLTPITVDEADAYHTNYIANPAIHNIDGIDKGFIASRTVGGGAASDAPISIKELAYALKYDIDLIYKFVHDKIEYYPTYGLKKGAWATLVDSSGNDLEQALLMVELLNESDASKGSSELYNAKLIFGKVILTRAELEKYYGISQSLSIIAATNILYETSIPISKDAPNLPPNTILLNHVWVQATIDGVDYVFDPSFKNHSVISKADLTSIMDYQPNTYMGSSANGAFYGSILLPNSGNPTSISNINRGNIRSNLNKYSKRLSNYIKENNPQWIIEDVIGGKKILPLDESTALRNTVLQYACTICGTFDSYTASAIPESYKSTLRIKHHGIDITLTADSIYGKVLHISYDNSYRANLYLAGILIASGNITSLNDQSKNIDFWIDVPFNLADDAFSQSINTGGTYVISNGWGSVGRGMVDFYKQEISQLKSDGVENNNLMPFNLSVLSYSWMAQNSKISSIIGALTDTQHLYHYSVGIAGYTPAPKNSPYVDMPGNAFSCLNFLQLQNNCKTAFDVLTIHSSMFESLSVESTTSAKAASTVTVFDAYAKTSNDVFFESLKSTFAIHQAPILSNNGYTSAQIARFNSFLNNPSKRIILPVVPNVAINQWSGNAYFSEATTTQQHSMGAVIGGGLLGGYATDPVASETISNEAPKNIASVILDKATELISDPVDHYRGNYIYGHDDLVTGDKDKPFPFTLSMQRSYNSMLRYNKGPLGNGHTHNFDISASPGTDIFQALGEDSALDASAVIAELLVSIDLMSRRGTGEHTSLRTPFKPFLVTVLGIAWLQEQILGNAVSVQKGANSSLYIKLPDGSYNSPVGDLGTLTFASSKYRYTTADKIKYNFNINNKIATIVNPAGITVTFAYNSTGKLTSVRNGIGRKLNITYSGDLISKIGDTDNRSVKYEYEANGNLKSFSDPLNNKTNFKYTGKGQLHQIFYPAKPTNPSVTNTYDSLGRIKEQLDPNGKLTKFYFAGFRTEMVDPYGGKTIFYNDGQGQILSKTNELGLTTRYRYDNAGNIIETIYPKGNRVVNNYIYRANAYPKIAEVTEVRYPEFTSLLLPTTKRTVYDSVWSKVSEVHDAAGNVTQYTYHATKGYLLTVTQPDPDGVGPLAPPTTTFTYNANGLPKTVTLPNGSVTEYTYNNDVLTRQSLDNTGFAITTNFTYSAWGDVASITNPSGSKIVFTNSYLRKPTNRKFNASGSGGALISQDRFTYDSNNNLTKIEKLSTLASAPASVTTFEYNNSDKVILEKNAAGNETNYSYDNMDRLEGVIDAEMRHSKTTYDAAGNVSSTTSAFGSSQARPVTRSYTANGLLASITDSRGNETTYTYDGFDRLIKTTYPDNSTEETTYDSRDNKITVKQRSGITTTYSYDALNRVVSRSIPGQATINFSYDTMGNVISAAFVGTLGSGDARLGTWTKSYDKLGRLTSESTPDGAITQYTYNSMGQLTRLTYPDGWYVQYDYDAADRLVAVKENGSTNIANYSYDSFSRRSGLQLANGITTSRSYDLNHRVTDENIVITPLSSLSFTHNYNAVNQRVKTAATDANWLWYPSSTAVTSYGVANSINQYPTVAGSPVSYDSSGNLTNDGEFSYTFDSENRMLSANKAGISAQYKYDPFGRRYSKTVNGITTRYVHSGTHEIAEYNGNVLSARHVFGENKALLMSVKAGSKYYAYTDLQGSVVAMTDSSKNITQLVTYSPWGESDAINNNASFGYTGHRYDAETGLYYYKARYYSPKLGRFLSNDPIGYADNLNMYAYVNNDPLNYIDPTGLAADAAIGMWKEDWDTMSQQSLPQELVDYAAGFGDIASFGITDYIRNAYGIDGNIDYTSNSYLAGMFSGIAGSAGTISAVGTAVNIGIRSVGGANTVYHYTSAANAANIAKSGAINPGNGFYGHGVYATAVNSPIAARISGAASTQVAIPISTSGSRITATPFPGSFRITGGAVKQ